MKDTYTVKTFKKDNFIIRVHTPELTEAERNRRLEIIKQAAANLLKEC